MVADKRHNKSELLSQLKIENKDQAPSSFPWKWSLIAGALLVLGIVLWSLVFHADDKAAGKTSNLEAAVSPSPAQAERSVGEESSFANKSSSESATLNASGYITPRRLATVSAQILGLITEVNVEEGMSVVTGQILARLDATVAKVNLDLATAQVRVLEARLRSLQADLDEAQRIKKRISGLSTGRFASDAEITQAQANVDKALSAMATIEADIEVAQINVRQQRAFFDKHTIRAPFSGVVIGKNAQPGEIVSPSSAGGGFTRTGICTIVDMRSLEIEVDVNESFIGRVFSGQKVIANLDAYPDWDIPASVIAVIPAANRAKATVRVRIKLDEVDERVLPDMGVKVAFF